MGGELAGIRESFTNMVELKRALWRTNHVAVAPDGLPESSGWYKIDSGTASLNPIILAVAKQLTLDGRGDEVLHVNQSAVDAARGGCRPLTLGVGYWDSYWYFFVDDCTHALALVALVMPGKEDDEVESPAPGAKTLLR